MRPSRLLTLLLGAPARAARFLWFTDNHVDLRGNATNPADVRCPWTPKAQWESAVDAMISADAAPDFIMFSGDFVHFGPRDGDDLTKKVILDTIGSVTETMLSSFPDIPLFPCLGNHDYSPSNNFPSLLAKSSWLYETIAEAWAPWLPEEALSTLRESGWYAADAVPGLRVLALNTNHWAIWNQFTDVPESDDLAHRQIAWLEDELERARGDGVKVYINGHHPAVGMYTDDHVEVDGLWPLYSMRYVLATQKYVDVIEGQFYGHDHVDEVRVVNECDYARPDGAVPNIQSCDGDASGVVYVGPALTNCNDPSFRVWDYDGSTFALEDYRQYHYRPADGGGGGADDWPLHYRWQETYGATMADLSPGSWKKELARLAGEGTEGERDAFFARRGTGGCDAHCRTFYWCNVLHTDMQAFLGCLYDKTRPNDKARPLPSVTIAAK